MADLQLDPRQAVPAIFFILQKIIEETFLQLAPIVRIEMSPVFDSMHFEPFLRGSRTHEALKISAWVQSLTAPIGRGKQGHRHFGPVRRATLAVIVIKWMREKIGAEIAAVAGEFCLS